MVRGGRRAAALPVAAKIGTHHGEFARQQRRNTAPHQVRLRKTVQQEERRTLSAGAHEDAGFTGLDFSGSEVVHDSWTMRFRSRRSRTARPHVLYGREIYQRLGRITSRGRARAFDGYEHSQSSSPAKAGDPVFRDANDGIERPKRTGYPPSRV